MKNNEFLPGTNTWREFSWIFSGIFCPAGPLSGNVDKKFTTFYLFFCPLGPLGKFWIKIALLFIWIFAPQGRSAEILVRNMLFFFAPQGRSTGILIRDSLHLFGFFSNRLSQFFPTQRCTPQNREVQFSQSRRHALQIRSGGSIFEEPALHAVMPQNQGGQFLKSRRFTPQNRRGGGSDFSKAGASSLKTGEGGSSFSKDGAMRLKTGWALSFKKRFNFSIVCATAKTGFQFFQSRR